MRNVLDEMVELAGIEGDTLSEGMGTGVVVSVPGHGMFSVDLRSDKFAKMSKREIVDKVLDIYDGVGNAQQRKASYWMKYPTIALVAIVGDAYPNG